MSSKLVTVFFDFEAPFLWKNKPEFDLVKTLQGITETLDQYRVKAVFNTCGRVAEKFPQVIKRLHDDGHEIASHGYLHENFATTSMLELNKALAKTEQVFQSITGEKPEGIRAPWLKTNESVYTVFRNRDYRWTSNVHAPFWATRSRVDFKEMSYPMFLIGKTVYAFKQLSHKEKPFIEDSLVEIPLLSPMDIYCIFPFPEANEDSPVTSLDEAYEILVWHYKKCRRYFNLNFHEHTVGTANRLQLLERILSYLSEQSGVSFVLPCQGDFAFH